MISLRKLSLNFVTNELERNFTFFQSKLLMITYDNQEVVYQPIMHHWIKFHLCNFNHFLLLKAFKCVDNICFSFPCNSVLMLIL